jgi:hypothetical protein
MDNINIKNIFINNDQIIKNNHYIKDKNDKDDNLFIEEFNTYSLSSKNKLVNIVDDNFILSKIKNVQKYENDKLNEIYETKFKECLLKINDAIDMNVTDIFYTVSSAQFGCKIYKSIECLKYIENKLRKKKFDTFIYSQNNIFISWKKL